MIGLLSIIAMGFFLGMRHATDPDHVIAVTTIVGRQRNLARAALVGAFWGLGHTLTIFVVGTAIILFNLVIPPRVGLSMEFSVGIMLVVLGFLNIRGFLRSMPAHDPEVHPHPLSQTPLARLDRLFARATLYQHLRPLVVGIVHGLAGSAAVALLVLTTVRDSTWAVAYLLVFGVGTIVGMMVITVGIASSFRVVARTQGIERRLAMASGLLSLAFGLVVAYQILMVNGLFSAHLQWTPR
ncbi:MAG TPA: hypothetical protein VMS96_14620 [Terriglobales bacterium]|nr:hypothetical protein [Terriglobales bacterium]